MSFHREEVLDAEVGWLEVARLECDYCSALWPENGGWEEIGSFGAPGFSGYGWTLWVGGLVVCPACRVRMGSTEAAA